LLGFEPRLAGNFYHRSKLQILIIANAQ